MSGFAGIFHLDGSPVDPERLHKMAQALQYRGQDGTKVWHDGAIGFVHVHFWTTPEEVGEEQPIPSADGRLWLTADARVDNRDELIPLLQAAGYLNKEIPTDAELILAAYERWGEDCAQHLIGDFAFALWDASARRLFLARDVIGIRQMYYAHMDGALYFGNTIGAILAALPRQPALNRPLIHEFLRGSYRRWICQTIYEDVRRLPPTHYLTVDREVHEPRLYYVLGSGPAPHCTSDEEWLQAFRDLFREAVRCRLRSTTPVGISVSGGLDSSAVACVAHELTQQQASLPEIRLYSLIYQETPAADESSFLDAVVAQCARFVTTRIVADQFWALREFGSDGGFPLDEPEIYALRSQTLAPWRSAVADGCRVILSGDGGDQVVAQNLYSEPQALRGLGWRDWLSEAQYFRMATRYSWLSLLFRAYILPLLPRRILSVIEDFYINFDRTRSWLKGWHFNYGRDVCPLERAFFRPPNLRPSAQTINENVRCARESARLSTLDLSAAYVGVEHRYPFFDRRLIDLLLYVPHRLIAWRGVDRVIVRESLAVIIPEVVRRRRDKCHFEELVYRGFSRERQRLEKLLHASRTAMLKFICLESLRGVFENDWQEQMDLQGDVIRLLCFEVWLQDKICPEEY
ncbi:MAG: asparagine synthase-related protein [Anaerolineae bacterium]